MADGRKNNGRKAGSVNKATAEMKEAKKQFTERVNKNVDKLFNSQLDLAIGEKYLMVVRTIGKGAKARRETSIVTDPEMIMQYLDDESSLDDENEYYFMTTKPANNQALDSLLNRSFGKPQESVDVTSGGDKLSVIVESVYGNKPNFRPDNQATETDEMATDSSQQSS